MAYKLAPRNLEPTSALEKTLRSIVDTEEVGVVKLGIGSDTVEINNGFTMSSATVTGNATVGGTLEVTGASTLTGAVTATAGVQSSSVSVTATTDGLTTGLIPSGSRFVTVTSDTATKVVVLPAAVIGNTVEITVPATGAELQTLAATSDTINGVDCSGANEMAMAAGSIYVLKCVAAATWVAYGWGSDGAAQATIVPDTDA